MKKIILLTAIILMAMVSMNFAGSKGKAKKVVNIEAVSENLLNGVNSQNQGLQVSSAHLLGEFEVQNAVIPLLRVFNNTNSEGVKIAAALSLLKIGDSRGIKAIEFASKYDDSQRVKNMCKRFYLYHVKENMTK